MIAGRTMVTVMRDGCAAPAHRGARSRAGRRAGRSPRGPQRRVLGQRHEVVRIRAVHHRTGQQHHAAYAGRGGGGHDGLRALDIARRTRPTSASTDMSMSTCTTTSTPASRSASRGLRTSRTATSPRRSLRGDRRAPPPDGHHRDRQQPDERPPMLPAAPVTATTGRLVRRERTGVRVGLQRCPDDGDGIGGPHDAHLPEERP